MQNKLVTRQDAMDYMEKMIRKHQLDLKQQKSRGASDEILHNIENKMICCRLAWCALKKEVGDSNGTV